MPSDALSLALDRLESEFRTGAPARVQLQESSSETTLQRMQRKVVREPEVRSTIDTTCQRWVQEGRWQGCDQEMAVFLWDRIVEARIFAQWLVERQARVDGDSGDEVLRWLLVDYWALAGFYRWYARLWAAQRAEG